MERIRNKPRLYYLIWLVSLSSFFLLSACGGGGSSSDDADTSAVSFSLEIHNNHTGAYTPEAAVIDCGGEGIVTIEANLYDQDNNFIKSSERWPCIDGQGTIANVPAGRILTIVAMGRDADDNIILRGDKSGIYVVPGGTSDAGTINCYRFVPSLLSPEDGIELVATAVSLDWNAVTNASRYGVLVYKNGDMNTPILHEETTELSYTPSGLLDSHTYHWSIYASDELGHHGGGSPIRSFDTIAIPHLAVGDLMGPGGEASDSAYTVQHTVGEPLIGTSASGGNTLNSGFVTIVKTYDPPIATNTD